MNLLIDIGNSSAKIAIMDGPQVVARRRIEQLDSHILDSLFGEFPTVEGAILCSLKEVDQTLEQAIVERVARYVRFTHQTPVPLRNNYATPQTLGLDRLAAAVGAATLYPEEDLLVVDFGTAITIDSISADGFFEGGNISAGASTRLKALNDYTSALPLLSLERCDEDADNLFGKSTEEAMLKGVADGVVFEIEGYISRILAKNSNFRVVFTGGDANFFAKRFKNTIFVTCDLVFVGLNRILEYNV